MIEKYNDKVKNQLSKYVEEGLMTKEEIKREFITPLKLQKLLYYVQGLSLSYFGKPTFFEDIVN